MKAKNVAAVQSYHHKIARQSFNQRRRASRELRRAEKEVGKRAIVRLNRIWPMASHLKIPARHMHPYVNKYGAHTVTHWIRDVLPPYYALKKKSVRLGDSFDGWMITRIG